MGSNVLDGSSSSDERWATSRWNWFVSIMEIVLGYWTNTGQDGLLKETTTVLPTKVWTLLPATKFHTIPRMARQARIRNLIIFQFYTTPTTTSSNSSTSSTSTSTSTSTSSFSSSPSPSSSSSSSSSPSSKTSSSSSWLCSWSWSWS